VSLLLWRSDGEAIEHFFVSPPAEAPPGLALYAQREDARHCRVEVAWVAPAAGVVPGPYAATFEVAVDGAATSKVAA
jgi:hypothetical protein